MTPSCTHACAHTRACTRAHAWVMAPHAHPSRELHLLRSLSACQVNATFQVQPSQVRGGDRTCVFP